MKNRVTTLFKLMRGALAVVLGLSLLAPALPAKQAQAALNVPQVIMYQGRLTDSNRITVDDGSYDMIFTIWDHVTDNNCGTDNLYVSGGTCGTPTATAVTVTDGVFTVALGSDTAALSDDLFDDAANNDFYLEITIEGETLSPRRQIGATAFALQAGDSHLLDDKAASAAGCTGACIPATDSSGNLLITGDPQGTGVSQGSLYINPTSPGAGETLLGIANNGSSRFILDAEGDGTFAGDVTATGNDLTFGNGENINNNTDGSLEFNANLIPDTDDTYNLGTSTARWQDLYLGPNSLHIGTNGNEGILSFDTANSVFNFDTTVRFDTHIRPEFANTSDSGDDGHRWQDLYVEDNGGIHIGDAGGEAADTEALINLSSGDLAFTSDDGFVFNIDDDNLGDDIVRIDNEANYALQVSRTGSNTGTGNYYGFDSTITNSTNEVDNTRSATIAFTRSGTVDTNTGGHSVQEARGLYVDYTATHDLDAALSGVQLANRGIEISYTETSSNAGDATNEENVGLLIGISSDSSNGRVHGLQIDVDSSISGQGGDGLKSESAIAITRGGIWLEGDGNTSFDLTSDVTGMGGDGTIFSGGDIEIYDGALCVGNASTLSEECSGALTDGTIYAVNTTVQGVDLAEMYPSADALMPGDIVSVSDDGDEFVAASTQGDTIIGAISTAPGLTLGRETAEDGYFPVALAGRVPVRVNNEGGAIAIGDRIAVSSQTGIGMRATEAGEVVGIAMQAASFAGSDTDAIVAFVQPHYWNGIDAANLSVTEQEPEPVVNAGQAFALGDLETSTIAALSGYNWSIDADGIFNTDGYYAVTIKSSQNTRVETYGVLGMEHYVTLAGTTRVENGMAWVDFELLAPEFNDVIDTAAPIIVTATPSDGEGVAYVTDKSGKGFQLHLANGSFATQVDWMVMAYRLNFPPEEPEDEPEEESEEEVEVSEEEDVNNEGQGSEEEGAEEESSSEDTGEEEQQQEDVSGDETQEENSDSAESAEETEPAENAEEDPVEESPDPAESDAPEQGEEEPETENEQETEVTPSDESDQSASSSEEEAST